MKRSMIRATMAALIFATGMMAGCSTTPEEVMRERARESADTKRKGPESPVVKNITNFSPALRCMDENLMMYGIRDLVVITEDIEDKTKKVSAGTKDMLISAVSEMTQRSRAIRLIAYGQDSGNLITFMGQREAKSIYQLNPLYGIRGSVSQYDENLSKETAGAGLSWADNNGGFGFGGTTNASASILGLDLTMMNAEDLTIVPGVTSNNTVLILRSGAGASVEAKFRKLGADFEMSFGQSEGIAQATRNLIQLAAIELIGKLTKTPYWSCLGSSANSSEVKDEISNWYYSLFANRGNFVAYWQIQMRLRGLYRGEANGQADDELRRAVELYREALGLQRNAKLDVDFFAAYLNANHYNAMKKAQNLLVSRTTKEVNKILSNHRKQQSGKTQSMKKTPSAKKPSSAQNVSATSDKPKG